MYEFIICSVFILPIGNYLLNYRNLSFMRTLNRAIVSYFAFLIPLYSFFIYFYIKYLSNYLNNYYLIKNIIPIDSINNILSLLHLTFLLQNTYYTIDLPIALIKKDCFQLTHHLIGYLLNYLAYYYGKYAPITTLMFYFIEQGSVIVLSTTLLLKFKYSSKELYNYIKYNYYLYSVVLILRLILYLYVLLVVIPENLNQYDSLKYIAIISFTAQYIWAYNSYNGVKISYIKLQKSMTSNNVLIYENKN